jgi:glycosyltransferase involved in cell wall biosynthesis
MPLTVEVIIPVRDLAEQLGKCLGPLFAQLGDADRLTVVDDASTDSTGDAAKALGANVIRIDASRGPYFARQVAAAESAFDALLFVDARCRALPGLLASHKELLSRPGIVLSCTETRTLSGRSLAARIAARQQPFSLAGKIGVPGRLDFFPTANLGVLRSAFEKVGGFRDMRSGADADLCWRIQQAGLGVMAADPTVRMDWAPRTSLRDLLEQWHRYGKSTAYLEWVYPDQSPSATGRPVSIADRLRGLGASGAGPLGALLPASAFQLGVRQGRREAKTPPKDY